MKKIKNLKEIITRRLKLYWDYPHSVRCVFCSRGTGTLLLKISWWRICFPCLMYLKTGNFSLLAKRRDRKKQPQICLACGIESPLTLEKSFHFLKALTFIGEVFLCENCEETAMRCSCCSLPWLQLGRKESCPICETKAKRCAACGSELGIIYSNNLVNPRCSSCLYRSEMPRFGGCLTGVGSSLILQPADEISNSNLHFLECYSCGVVLPDYRFQERKVCKLCAPNLISSPEEAKRMAEEIISHLNQKFGLFFSLNIPTFLPVQEGKEQGKYDLFYLKDVLDASQGKFDLSASLLVPDVCRISRTLFPYWIAWLIGKRLLKKNLPSNPPYYLKSLPHRIMYEIADWKQNDFRKKQILKKHGNELLPYFILEKKYGTKEVMAFSFRCASAN